MILALDLSKARTGWAVWPEGSPTARFGHWVLGSEFTTDGGVYAKLHRSMADLHAVAPFQFVYFEQPIHPAQLTGSTSINAIRLAAGLAAHAESFAHAYGLRGAVPVNVETWRPEFIGRVYSSDAKARARRAKKAGDSRASARGELKRLTIERCRQLGFSPRFDDEADALGLLDYAMAARGIVPPWRRDEVLREPLGAVA